MYQIRREASMESMTSLNIRTQKLDQRMDSIQNIPDLDGRLGSSLHATKELKSKSTDEQVSENRNISLSSDLEESGPKITTKLSLKATQPSTYESSSRSAQSPKSRKIVSEKQSSTIKETTNSKRKVRTKSPLSYSRTKPGDKVLPNPQYFSSTHPKLNPPSYQCNLNSHFHPKVVNSAPNEACAYPGRYPEQSIIDPDIDYRQDVDRLHYQHQALNSALDQTGSCINRFALPGGHEKKSKQWQVSPANIRTAARPVILLSRNDTYNPMPPIRTNATPIRYIQNSSYYKSPMPSIKTAANPITYIPPPERYQKPMLPLSRSAISRKHIPPLQATTSNVYGSLNCSPDSVQSKRDSTIPAVQTQNSAPSENHKNTSSPNRGLTEVAKLEDLAKRVHYSKKTMLKIHIPTKIPLGSYFPLNAAPQGGFLLRQVQRTPIQFPAPSESANSGTPLTEVREAIQPLTYPTVRSCTQPYINSDFHPVGTNGTVPRTEAQENTLIQSVSNACNPIQHAIQAQVVTPQMVQYQPSIQNFDTASLYQDPNNLIYQYGTQYKPSMQNLTVESRCQNSNHPMCQFGTQCNVLIQNQSVNSQYQNPNNLVHQHGNQNHPIMQNLSNPVEYEATNHAMYHNGRQRSVEYFGSPDIPMTPAFDANIPFREQNSSILPMQTFPTNPSIPTTSMIQNPTCNYESRYQSHHFTHDLNVVQNNAVMQTSEENPSPIIVSQYPPEFYAAIQESTNF